MKPCWEHNSELAPWTEYWMDKSREMSHWQEWKTHLFPYLKSVKFCEISLTTFVILKLVSTNVKNARCFFKLSNLEKMKVALVGASDPNWPMLNYLACVP